MGRALASFAVALAWACSAGERVDATPPGSALTGSVTYLERIALPGDAVLHVTLLDLDEVGRDGSARLVARAIPFAGRSVPLDFRLELDGVRLEAGGSYVVTARIGTGGGETLFRTPAPEFVLTNGAPTDVELVLRRAGGGPPPPPRLLATHWRAKSLGGQPVVPLQGRRHPYVVLQGPEERYVGHGGANRFRGTYERDGAELRFRPGPMTRMGGEPRTMELEQALLGALMATRTHSIDGDELTLHGAEGPVAVFDAAELR